MVKFLDLASINSKYKDELLYLTKQVLDSGWYILGQQVIDFEESFSQYCDTTHCFGISNGLDALNIIFRGLIEEKKLNKGDHVLVPSNTFIASVLAITYNGLVPIFVEPDSDSHNITHDQILKNWTKQTKAVLLVHLYGQNAYTDEIGQVCKQKGMLLIEDAAQAHGATYKGRKVGSLGNYAAFSFYPGKNMGAIGDAGAITTSDQTMEKVFRSLRNYGSQKKYHNDYCGFNNRMDELQAAYLKVKLKYLDEEILERRAIASYYLNHIRNEKLVLPKVNNIGGHVWHLFVIKTRDRSKLIKHLDKHEVQSIIHYPIPPHLQRCYKHLGLKKGDLPVAEKLAQTVLSIPLWPGLPKSDMDFVVETLNRF